jgi:hypothetical protein
MVWYNPFTWFSSAPEEPAALSMPAAPAAPAPPPIGGRRRKTHRRGRRNGSKKIRSGKKPSH